MFFFLEVSDSYPDKYFEFKMKTQTNYKLETAQSLCESKHTACQQSQESIAIQQTQLSVLKAKLNELAHMEKDYQKIEGQVAQIQVKLDKVLPFLEQNRFEYQIYQELRKTSLDGISLPEHGSHPVKIIKYQNYLKISMTLSEEKDKLLTEIEELQFCITDEKAENENRQYQMSQLQASIKSEQSLLAKRQIEYLMFVKQLTLWQRQSDLDSLIPKLLEFIAENWEQVDDMADSIRAILSPEYCCLPTKQIEAFLKWLEQHMDDLDIIYGLIEYEEEETIPDQITPTEELYQQVIQDFGPELVVAVANTVCLVTDFSEEFYNGRYGMIRTSYDTRGNTHLKGNYPLEVQDMIESPPDWFTKMLDKDVRYHKPVCLSFRREHGVRQQSCPAQLFDMTLFRKHFWRVENFYGFSITSELHVLPSREGTKNCERALAKHIAQQKNDGVYLESDCFV
jgi:hypothetical protein